MAKVISITQSRKVTGNLCPSLHENSEAPVSCRSALIELCASLEAEEKQRQFRAFPEGYCREFRLSLEQIHAVTDLDIPRLLRLGLTLTGLGRLASVCDLDAEELCQAQTGQTLEEIARQYS